jgi:hypothetical protein
MARTRETIIGKEIVIMTPQCPPRRYTPLISSMAPMCLQTYILAPRLAVVIHRKLNPLVYPALVLWQAFCISSLDV